MIWLLIFSALSLLGWLTLVFFGWLAAWRRRRSQRRNQVRKLSSTEETVAKLRTATSELRTAIGGDSRYTADLARMETVLADRERRLTAEYRALGVEQPLPDLDPYTMCGRCSDMGAHLVLRCDEQRRWVRRCVACDHVGVNFTSWDGKQSA